MMSVSKKILQQIINITEILVDRSLCNHQNLPFLQKGKKGYQEIGIAAHYNPGSTLKNVPYCDLYAELCRTQTYNLRMLDGALIQMIYSFKNDRIESHRLAFFPSPFLDEFQNNPEVYLIDEIYADVIAKNIVPFPFRFDFDNNLIDVQHPKSHLTLGQYRNCRIPVSAPMMPYHFIIFILMNFYNTALKKYPDEIPYDIKNIFTETITNNEKKLIYVQVPK
jgi:hypothetical protein